MANYSNLNSTINAVVRTNGNEEITGENLNGVLREMVSVLGQGYQFVGICTPSTNPGTPDARVFYLAIEAGTYSNFGGANVTSPTILYYDTTWHAQPLDGNFSATLRVADIINNLTSAATDKPLAAAQGKVLYELITEGYLFVGIATPTTTDNVSGSIKCFWLAATKGDYPNLGNVSLNDNEIAVISRNAPGAGLPTYTKFTLGTYVQTSDIADNLNTDNAAKVLSAKQGKVIADITMEKVYEGNYLNPASIIQGKMYDNSSNTVKNISSAYQTIIYGCTDYIEISPNGFVINWVSRTTGASSQYRPVVFFDENYNNLGFASVGNIGSIVVPASNYPAGAKYIRVNLGYGNPYDGYAIYDGTELPSSGYSEYVAPHMALKNSGKFASGEALRSTKIVNDLTTGGEHDVLSAEQGKAVVPIKGGVNLINPNSITRNKSINSSGEIVNAVGAKVSDFIPIDNNEYIASNGNSGTGTYKNAVYDRDKVFVRLTPKLYQYEEGDDPEGYVRFAFSTSTNIFYANYGNTVIADDWNPIGGYLPANVTQNLYAKTIQCAKGAQYSYGTEASEKAASVLEDDGNIFNVGYEEAGDVRQTPIPDKIVLMNHDDGNLSDLIGTRKIYNKYGFHANYCVVLYPFTNLTSAKQHIENGRRMVSEGHELGLHSIMNCSYWFQNRMFDIRPDGTSTFAPTLTEFLTAVGETTDNVFHMSVNSLETTKVSSVFLKPQFTSSSGSSPAPEGLSDLWSKYFDGTGAITQQELQQIETFYNLYYDRRLTRGLLDCDYDDIMAGSVASYATKTRLQWLEYWYNHLIDDSLGYSTPAWALVEGVNVSTPIADMFAADYSVPSGASAATYYPDKNHILSGKMVYWNDTAKIAALQAAGETILASNETGFSADAWQKVGKFTTGLFKDCFTTCNYEVLDREVAVAQAFFRKYYGLNHFTDQHVHGTTYFTRTYFNTDDNRFLDRDFFVNEDMNGRMFSSRLGTYVTARTIMEGYGINICKETQYRHRMEYEGQIGHYYGIDKIKAVGCYGGTNGGQDSRFKTDETDFLAMFGITTDTGQENMSYQDFVDFVEGIDDWLAYCFDNAGTEKTRGGITANVCDVIKPTLLRLFASVGTGKIPILSFDTLNNSPAIMAAVDILLRALKRVGFQAVSFEEGARHILSHPRSTGGNLFPNPCFAQNLWKMFGYSQSIDQDARIPDGWYCANLSQLDIEVDKTGASPILHASNTHGSSAANPHLVTRIYGLPSGTYTLSYKAKATATGATVTVAAITNGTRLVDFGTTVDTYNVTDEWVVKEITINIPEFQQHDVDYSDAASVVCQGCEDNICAIEVRLIIPYEKDIYIKEPMMTWTTTQSL